MRAHIVRGIPEGAEFSEQFLALRHIGVVAFVVSDESPRMIHRADNGAGIDFDMSRLAQDVLSLARSSTANQVHRFGAQLRTLNDKLMTSLTLFLLLSSRTPLFLEFAWRPSLAADRRTLPNHTRFPIRGAILPLRSRIDGDTASLHGTRSRGIGMAPRQTHRQRLCRIKKPDAGANPGIRSSNAPIRPADDPPRSTDPTNPGGRDRCPRRPRCARAARGSSCRRPPGCWPGGAVSTRTRSRPC